jgi:hypothetical protein
MRPFYLSTYLLHSHKTYIPLQTSWMVRKSCPFLSNPSCIELKVWNLKFCSLHPKFPLSYPHLVHKNCINCEWNWSRKYNCPYMDMKCYHITWIMLEWNFQSKQIDLCMNKIVFMVAKFCTHLISTIWKLDDKPNCDYGSNLLHNVCLIIWMHWITWMNFDKMDTIKPQKCYWALTSRVTWNWL